MEEDDDSGQGAASGRGGREIQSASGKIPFRSNETPRNSGQPAKSNFLDELSEPFYPNFLRCLCPRSCARCLVDLTNTDLVSSLSFKSFHPSEYCQQ